jgi:phosphatidylserine/phosphatidylglycerophosphate/cardiolipin synthase-like enzyme
MSRRTAVLLASGLVIAAIVLGIGVVMLVTRPSAPALRLENAQSGGWFTVYFTAPKNPARESNPPDSLDAALTRFIQSAQSRVDMAASQLDLPGVIQALLDAKRRGVVVRVVTDVDILADKKENQAFKELQSSGIPVVGGNPKGIMHDKFVVVDQSAVWTGSWNLTTNDTYRYNNNTILIRSPELARNYTATFEKMFADKTFGTQRKPGGTTPRLTIGGSMVENYFAPEDRVAAKIIARLKQAARTIDFLAYSFTDDDIGSVILERAQGGVKVRGVFEMTGADTPSGEYSKMKQAGLDVWRDGNPYLMHHKVFIIDGKTVIFGSFNFTQRAEEENDENLLIVDDLALAAQFEDEFARVYEQAKSVRR